MSDNRRLAAILAADVVGYSHLMGEDESGTVDVLKLLRRELFSPAVSKHNGRIVKLMGDGALVEFASAVDAVKCAIFIQTEISKRNEFSNIKLRIGINIGDVLVEDSEIYGDGVNIAARLEGMAEPGGIFLSDIVQKSVAGKIDAKLTDLGERVAKNISQPIHVWSWKAEDDRTEEGQDKSYLNSLTMEQDIRFCMTSDDVQIAYATVGSGPPLVKAPNWMHHLEYEWKSPIWRHLLKELAKNHTLIRFDLRANGLSDWSVGEISLDAFSRDLATVVDAVGLERFPLLGISQGCAISIKYIAENPGKVSHLILYGGFAQGRLKRASSKIQDEENAMLTLMRVGWGQHNPAFRQMFTTKFIPDGTKEQMDWFNELERISVSPENAVRIRENNNNIDITPLLSQINIPTLVMHCRGDAVVPFEEGRRLAASIPNARFVPLDGNNHLILEHQPSWPRFLEEVRNFLSN